MDVSTDNSRTWRPARLGADHARYAWRLWEARWMPAAEGSYVLMSKTTDEKGDPSDYEMGVDRTIVHGDGASAFIKARSAHPRGVGTLMQSFQANDYRGKRLRFSGYVKTDGDPLCAALWLRVDGSSGTLSIDDMRRRPINRTTDWKKYELVADIPEKCRVDTLRAAVGWQGRCLDGRVAV